MWLQQAIKHFSLFFIAFSSLRIEHACILFEILVDHSSGSVGYCDIWVYVAVGRSILKEISQGVVDPGYSRRSTDEYYFIHSVSVHVGILEDFVNGQ